VIDLDALKNIGHAGVRGRQTWRRFLLHKAVLAPL
jgi:hypothetical protein